MVAPVQKLRDVEAEWMAKATQSAIDAARNIVMEGDINGRTPMGMVSEIEWGWIVAAAIFAWIKTKAEQAKHEGCGYEEKIRYMPDYFPQPWDAGAVASILPELGDLKGVDWRKPVESWTQQEMIRFTWNVYRLVQAAIEARDAGAESKITQGGPARVERDARARAGGPLMTQEEMDDDIPF